MKIALDQSKKKTAVFTVDIAWSDVEKKQEAIVDKLIKDVEVKGFRKGKAPKNLAEKQLKKHAVLQSVLKELAAEAVQESLKKHKVNAFGRPKIEAVKAQEGKDWQIRISVAEKPDITLGDYKKAIQELKKSKTTKIWLPGEKKTKENEKPKKPTIGEILDAVYKSTKIELSELLIEQEVERMLSQLLHDSQKLGLTIEKYLSSIGKTIEQIKKEYQLQANKTYTLELALESIAEKEKIIINDKEIDDFIAKTKDEKEKKNLTNQRYQLASILRRQKTMQRLLEL